MRSLIASIVGIFLVAVPVEGLDARAAAPADRQGAARPAARARRPGAKALVPPATRAAPVPTGKRIQRPGRPLSRRGITGSSARRCRARQDLREPLTYLDGGSVWIPAEARCGGRFPVIVLLHGNNTDKETVKSIGGGRHLDRWARRYLNGKLVEPLVLAEPIHFGACAPDERRRGLPYLFTGAFDFKVYRRKLEAALARHGIRASSWSFIGHSGAACCLSMGMFSLAEAWPEIRVWASADGCYSDTLQAAAIEKQLGQSGTRVFNACRGHPAYQGYRAYERALLTRGALEVKCDSTYYKQCKKHPSRPWFSFTTQFTGAEKHGKVLEELFKTIVFNQFPSERRLVAAKRAAERRLAAAKRAAERRARLAARRRSQPMARGAARTRVARRAPAPERGLEAKGSPAAQGVAHGRGSARPGILVSRDE